MYEIKKLSQEIIKTIAAGEVVERPYSIVKELLENSLDAGSKNINIFVDDHEGLYIRIVDDGVGIKEEYLSKAVERHATSKLVNQDLSEVKTLGFRGEALYAIAAASQMTIISRTTEMTEAKKLIIKDNTKSDIIPSSGKFGTEIIVEEIFKNIPARKKFLKSNRSELYAIRDTIKRISFSHPNVCINYYENKKIKYLFEAGKKDNSLKERIYEILGAEFINSSLFMQYENKIFSFQGYISLPTYNRPNWNDTIIILNNRVIKDRELLGVIRAGYAGLMASKRFPIIALCLNIHQDNVDFNVHPAKTEVRIINKKIIHSILIKNIRLTLEKSGLISSVFFENSLIKNFNTNTNFQKKLDIEFRLKNKNFEQNSKTTEPDAYKENKDFPLGFAVAQINKMFIISQSGKKLILTDQHAAHERIVLEKIRHNFMKKENQRQILLIPEIIKINENKKLLFLNKREINRLGIIFEDYGDNTILVREMPSVLGKINIQHLLEDLIINIKNIGNIDAKNSNIEKKFSSNSCHNSIRAGRALNIEEMNSLLRLMEETPNAGQCNHGRPTFIELSFKDIEGLFGRT